MSVSTIQPNPHTGARPSSWPDLSLAESRRVAWAAGLIVLLLIAVYYQVLWKLVVDWWEIPDASHGFLLPPFAVYLVWSTRTTLCRTELRPMGSGVAIVAAGLAILVLGVFGAELFLSRISLLIVLTGLILSFGGRKLLAELRFPLLILLLAIPLPAIIYGQITLPLQTLAARAAGALLPLFAVPVLREGHVIVLPSMKLEVAQACSGIRSLMSLLTISILYGYFLERSLWTRTMLALVTVPIAIAANCLRIVGTGICVQYWGPEEALGFFHEFSGWVIFSVSLLCLCLVHGCLSLPKKWRPS
jgi:exosortase